jgi:hypothetical protein
MDRAGLYEKSVALSSRGVRRVARSMRSTQYWPKPCESGRGQCLRRVRWGHAPHTERGGYSQPAGERFPGGPDGGTDTTSTGVAFREWLAQPKACRGRCSVGSGCVHGRPERSSTAAWLERNDGLHPQRLSGRGLQPGVLKTPVGSGLAGTRHSTSAGELRRVAIGKLNRSRGGAGSNGSGGTRQGSSTKGKGE